MARKRIIPMAFILLWTMSTGLASAAAYCPQNCTCTSQVPPLLLFGLPQRAVANIQCRIREDGFVLHDEVKHILSSRNYAPLLFLVMKCDDSIRVQWDDASFLERTMGLVIGSCRFDQATALKFPNRTMLVHLQLLNVGENFLQKTSFNGLENIRTLFVDGNALSTIPISLRKAATTMKDLFQADFSSNQLKTFDCDLFRHSRYHGILSIYYKNNSMTQIPPCFCNTSYLSVDFSHNKITDISYLGCSQTNNFNLSFNKITTIPKFYKDRLHNLMSLILDNNNISVIKTGSFVQQLLSLQTLSLANNKITKIEHHAFGSLNSLVKLSLNGNRLQTFDKAMAPTATIHPLEIDLRNNTLKHPPYENHDYTGPSNSVTLIAGNPYQCDCAMGRFIEALKRSDVMDRLRGVESAICKTPQDLSGSRLVDLNFNETCDYIDECPTNCKCVENKSSETVAVDCRQSNLTSMPDVMPEGFLKVDLSGNAIQVLQRREYLNSVLELDLSHNQLNHVSELAMHQLDKIAKLCMDNNNLGRLPRILSDWHPVNLTSLRLHNNPWQCSCQTLWLKTWLSRFGSILKQPQEVRCYKDGRYQASVLTTAITCTDYKLEAISVSTIAALCLLAGLLVWYYRWEIRLLLHMHLKRYPFDGESARQKTYDVFISYSEEDAPWVRERLVQILEKEHQQPLRVCFHERDFICGAPIASNIQSAIEDSLFVIIVMSPAFLRSEWCMFEFKLAHNCMLKNIIANTLIVLKEMPDIHGLDVLLRSYFRTKAYLDVRDDAFINKLYDKLKTNRKQDELQESLNNGLIGGAEVGTSGRCHLIGRQENVI